MGMAGHSPDTPADPARHRYESWVRQRSAGSGVKAVKTWVKTMMVKTEGEVDRTVTLYSALSDPVRDRNVDRRRDFRTVRLRCRQICLLAGRVNIQGRLGWGEGSPAASEAP